MDRSSRAGKEEAESRVMVMVHIPSTDPQSKRVNDGYGSGYPQDSNGRCVPCAPGGPALAPVERHGRFPGSGGCAERGATVRVVTPRPFFRII